MPVSKNDHSLYLSYLSNALKEGRLEDNVDEEVAQHLLHLAARQSDPLRLSREDVESDASSRPGANELSREAELRLFGERGLSSSQNVGRFLESARDFLYKRAYPSDRIEIKKLEDPWVHLGDSRHNLTHHREEVLLSEFSDNVRIKLACFDDNSDRIIAFNELDRNGDDVISWEDFQPNSKPLSISDREIFFLKEVIDRFAGLDTPGKRNEFARYLHEKVRNNPADAKDFISQMTPHMRLAAFRSIRENGSNNQELAIEFKGSVKALFVNPIPAETLFAYLAKQDSVLIPQNWSLVTSVSDQSVITIFADEYFSETNTENLAETLGLEDEIVLREKILRPIGLINAFLPPEDRITTVKLGGYDDYYDSGTKFVVFQTRPKGSIISTSTHEAGHGLFDSFVKLGSPVWNNPIYGDIFMNYAPLSAPIRDVLSEGYWATSDESLNRIFTYAYETRTYEFVHEEHYEKGSNKGHPWDNPDEFFASSLNVFVNHAEPFVSIIKHPQLFLFLPTNSLHKARPGQHSLSLNRYGEAQKIGLMIWCYMRDRVFGGMVFTKDHKDPFAAVELDELLREIPSYIQPEPYIQPAQEAVCSEPGI